MYFICDEVMLEHKIEWDSYHIEQPERLRTIVETLNNEGLLDKATILPSRRATEDEIAVIHKKEYINKLKDACSKSLEEMEEYCRHEDDVYINGKTYDAALMAAGCAIDGTIAAFNNKSSSFIPIRPPGHHAFKDRPCGFCFFNNVAIAAKHARGAGAQRVLIVDWDVHAGQGTQECIEGDDNIRLISIHRFQDGTFWPNLEQSAVSHKFENTMNVPLNSIGENDSSYIAIFHLLVLPTIIDFCPDLIIVSCGFDAAIGDPEGEMAVTPYGFGRMTELLVKTGIPLSVILEGGYFLPSIAKDGEYVVRALQGESFPILPSEPLSRTLRETFHRIFSSSNSPTLRSFDYLLTQANVYDKEALASHEYKGKLEVKEVFPTRGVYHHHIRSAENHQKFVDQLESAMDKYKNEGKMGKRVAIIIDGDSDFDMVEDKDGSVTIETPPSLHGMVQATIASYINPSFPPSINETPMPQNEYGELNKLYDKLIQLSTNPSFSHIPLIQLLTKE